MDSIFDKLKEFIKKEPVFSFAIGAIIALAYDKEQKKKAQRAKEESYDPADMAERFLSRDDLAYFDPDYYSEDELLDMGYYMLEEPFEKRKKKDPWSTRY